MDVVLIKTLQLILAFAILVIIHEFGHFLFARLFGIKVERFYIFFNPKFSLFKWKPKKYSKFLSKNTPYDSETESDGQQQVAEVECVSPETDPSKVPTATDVLLSGNAVEERPEKPGKTKKSKKSGFWSETEYGIGWLPLGGYCKIAGMIDESMDKEQMAKPPQPWEFRTKPAWQRLLVMIAGVLFNFLLAILIYAGIVYATGEKYVTFRDAKEGMHYSPLAKSIGFQDGDIPIAADGKPIENPYEDRITLAEASKVTVLRDGKEVQIALPADFLMRLNSEAEGMKNSNSDAPILFYDYRIPAKVKQTMNGEGAATAGIREGDLLIAVGNVSTPYMRDFREELKKHADSTVDITVVRPGAGKSDTLVLPVKLSPSGKMGIGLEVDPAEFYNAEVKEYGLLESVPRGVQKGTKQLTEYVGSMGQLFKSKEAAQSVGGFGAIGSIFPEKWDWLAFWNIAAFLSVALAFMNILPIPALDGGHVMFLLYEVIFRRPPNQKFMEYAQMTGMILLILLLLYANGMDIVRLFK